MLEYLERLRAKPNHVRERIALGSAAGFTALVAVGWMAVVGTNGMFGLGSASPAEEVSNLGGTFEEARSEFTSLLGAAGATEEGSSAPSIVVQTEATTTLEQPMRTSIPF